MRWLFLAVLAACCCLHGLGSAAVISIDFGSEWIKVALVKVSVTGYRSGVTKGGGGGYKRNNLRLGWLPVEP